MSKGYISKKRLRAKRLRRLRKKTQNFSCATCEKFHNFSCDKIYNVTRVGIGVHFRENCPKWKGFNQITKYL